MLVPFLFYFSSFSKISISFFNSLFDTLFSSTKFNNNFSVFPLKNFFKKLLLSFDKNFFSLILGTYTTSLTFTFLDSTTGEIIGGHTLDYIYSASQR